jgi:hypothetical protein
MSIKLIVTNDFGDYKRGDQITDAALVDEIRASHNASNVVPVAAAPEFVAVSPPAPAKS